MTFKSAERAASLTLSQYDSFISWELSLDRLGGQVLPALPQVPLGTAKPAEPPEVSPVAPCRFWEGVLHARELLGSVDGQQTDTVKQANGYVINLARLSSPVPKPEDIT